MKIVWHKTGDFIELDVLNHDLIDFLKNHWSEKNINGFYYDDTLSIQSNQNELFKSWQCVNDVLKNFLHIHDLDFDITCDDLLNQDILNKLHENWVILNRKHPNIGNVLDKKLEKGKFYFDNINLKIHDLETSFTLKLHNNDLSPIPNENKSNITSFNTSNIFLHYKNLGRQTFNKWCSFDKSIQNIDRNDFKEFYGVFTINLDRPRTMEPPKEYVEWCKLNDIDFPYGDKIPLANFSNLEENLTTYRLLFMKNFSDTNNFVRIES